MEDIMKGFEKFSQRVRNEEKLYKDIEIKIKDYPIPYIYCM